MLDPRLIFAGSGDSLFAARSTLPAFWRWTGLPAETPQIWAWSKMVAEAQRPVLGKQAVVVDESNDFAGSSPETGRAFPSALH